ncbi:putative glycerate dehydrogenase [Streptomyces bingchenggensis BCW-1]|uniref:Putative glycerate dehydrogenase n=1 Tax=Streptomyces bingchenggensis (strain BCW-1) TaxID=749414 RepID=D7CBL8_STRBB|nr:MULTISPECIES: hydroxyacid dehydrogenase [Streptomyces]ADI12895.1 putative glycerate dehydrogenase [Streptomyces bingchenggensis BCW-1]
MPTSQLPRALFAMDPAHLSELFPPRLMHRLQSLTVVDAALVVRDFGDPAIAGALAEAELLLTGWGCPHVDSAVLDRAPHLRAVLHSGGSVRGWLADAVWERGLTVSSAVRANALPVAEYALAAILFAGKGVFGLRERFRAEQAPPPADALARIGNLGRRVGIIGASQVGRRVLELLAPFEFEIALYDPYVDDATAAALGAVALPLDRLLATSDIVSLHAPDTPETQRMLDERLLGLMPDGAVFINTARGALVDPDALTKELVSGRISAILDVTEPEPLPGRSPLYDLPNVFLTPHLAGSLGNELERLGRTVVDELQRLVAGEPLLHTVNHAHLVNSA